MQSHSSTAEADLQGAGCLAEPADRSAALAFSGLTAERGGQAVLTDLFGWCDEGEVLVVVGGPGSGRTSLLHAINGDKDVSVVSGRLCTGEGRVVMMAAQDTLTPHLTVRQTLVFAATMGGGARDAEERAEWAMEFASLSGASETKIGNTLRRGVSGGERRRVSIAEAILLLPPRGGTLCLDEWCEGLDAGTTALLASRLRELARSRGIAIVQVVRQPCSQIFANSDHVLSLESGRQVSFGVPSRVLPEAAVREAAARRCDSGSCPPADWPPIPLTMQFRTLLWRERCTAVASPGLYIGARLLRYLLQALILGCLFFQMGKDQRGAYNRMGLLFTSMLTLSLGAFALMPEIIENRAVFHKEKKADVYQPMLWIVSKAVFDGVLCGFETLMVAAVIYPMTALNVDADRALCFFVVLWALALACSNLIRLFVTLSPDLAAAQAAAGGALVTLAFFSGYLLPKSRIPVWWKWAYHVSPFSYAYEALVVNEYSGLHFHCTPSQTLPPSEVSDECAAGMKTYCGRLQGHLHDCGECAWRHRSPLEYAHGCSVPQAEAWCLGNGAGYCPPQWTTGAGYVDMRLSISADASDLPMRWTNVAVLVLYAAALLALSALATRWAAAAPRRWADARAARPDPSADSDEEHDEKAPILPVAADAEQPRRPSSRSDCTIRFRQVQYSVASGATLTHIIQAVDGSCGPGRLLALLGATGAGKTTLLDVLAHRKSAGTVGGTIEIGGAVRSPSEVRQLCAYVEQDVKHQPTDTVREALELAARLRGCQSAAEARGFAVRTAAMLGLSDALDKLVGDSDGCGLPPHALRLLTVGTELAADPSVLFCDEPTTGLDEAGAARVVAALRRAADEGRAVVCSIHRPTQDVFRAFDDMLVLSGGRQVYAGPVADLTEYVRDLGVDPAPVLRHPAAGVLELVSRGVRPTLRRVVPEVAGPTELRLSGARFRVRGGDLQFSGCRDVSVQEIDYDKHTRRVSVSPAPGCEAAELPHEGLPELLGTLRTLAGAAGARHNIPAEVPTEHCGEWRGDGKRLWCSHPHRPDGTLCGHGSSVLQYEHWSCCGARAGEQCTASASHVWARAWHSSGKARALRVELRSLRQPRVQTGGASAWSWRRSASALPHLVRRRCRAYARTGTYAVARVAFTVVAAVLFGTTYWRLGNTQTDIQDTVAVIAATASTGVVAALGAVAPILDERPVAAREVSAGMYTTGVYAVTNLLVEAPLSLLNAFLWVGLLQVLCGFPSQSFSLVFLAYCALMACMSHVGVLAAVLSPTLMIAEIVVPVCHMIWSLHCGFLILHDDIPPPMLLFEWLNPYTYFVRSASATILHDRGELICTDGEFVDVPAKFCVSGFMNATPTVTPTPDANVSATATPTVSPLCPLCPVTDPDTFLSFYSWHYSSRWTNVAGLWVCTLVLAALVVVASNPARYARK